MEQLQANTTKLNVLLVEDSPIVQLAHQRYLEGLGCSVEVAENGQKALEMASNNCYDMVFMDMGLPDINGAEVIRRLRQPEIGLNNAPIIAVTGYNRAEDRYVLLEAGANDILIKPITIMDLQRVIERFRRK
jgi:two-component system aerobic respiration control sensor histidine kinase ArcB